MDKISNSLIDPTEAVLPSGENNNDNKAPAERDDGDHSMNLVKDGQRNSYRYFIALCAVIGAGLMAYLTYTHYANVKSFCDISAEVSCDVVTTSIYSEIFGIPVSVLGLLYFVTILAMVLIKRRLHIFQLIFFGTVLMLVPSLYLTLTEVFFIKSFCVLCEISKVLMILIIIFSWLAARRDTPGLVRLSIPFIIAGVVGAGVMYFAQTGIVVKSDYSGLVEHMNKAGWVYYKSYICSNCRRQEALLGEAYNKVNAVECHPDGPNGNPELCLKNNITKTPTWILERDGVEVRRVEGLQTIEALMEMSDYKVLKEIPPKFQKL